MNTDKNIDVAVIPGDGIGPEIMKATIDVLDALGAPFNYIECEAGLGAFEKYGDALPENTLKTIQNTRFALKGPLATPSAGGYRSATVRMREIFNLYANVRPGKTLIPSRFDNVDIVLIRENLEGLYASQEYYEEVDGDEHGIAYALASNSKAGMKRIIRYAADLAIKQGRKRVTVVHKANILKVLTGIFLEAANELTPEYEGKIVIDSMIVDAAAMNLVLHPERFDIIVTTNLFGDILSDLIAGLVGGLGLVPGGNIGDDAAIFEAVHGTAPDIAGRGIANPTALIMAAAMLLDHTGNIALAKKLRGVVQEALLEKQCTGDVGGKLNTEQYAQVLIQKLKQ